MINYATIKLIIWDLDETLWHGTLSDNTSIELKNNFVEFINDSLDRGIVHSICSKNAYDDTKNFLSSINLWDLFVFPSIDWSPKGERICNLIKDMGLRAENVLFVDDNVSNLQEAKHYCKTIQICSPEELEASIPLVYELKKSDKSRPRLRQYRVLEKKVDSQRQFSSNEDFLMSCCISVDFHNDCIENIDRIHELILRSNQLNYTKFRQEKDDLLADLSLPDTQAAYITAKDSFGDYGIVGFYSIVNGNVKHFLFSCRTLGMLVEQYVYVKIGCPEINVVGDVITQLNNSDVPAWINNCNNDSEDASLHQKRSFTDKTILFKGPCDVSAIFSYIAENSCIKTEFSYVNDAGIRVEGCNHTSQWITAINASPKEKAMLVEEIGWFDEKMLSTSFYENDAIVFSLLTDANLGIYQHKTTGWQIALCEKYYDLTDRNNWEKYINKTIFTSQINFSEEDLINFSDKYFYVNNSEGEVTLKNLDIIYKAKSKKTKLILMLGSEKPFNGPTTPPYKDRHIVHKIFNDKIKDWARDKNDVYLINVTDYITSSNDYYDIINHYKRPVYYKIAKDVIKFISSGDDSLEIKGKGFYLISVIKTRYLHFKKYVRKLLSKLSILK